MSVNSIEQLDNLSKALICAGGNDRKARLLLQLPAVKEFFDSAKPIQECITRMDENFQTSLLSVIAIGEGEIVFQGWRTVTDLAGQLENLARQLEKVEQFYCSIGGVVGYHKAVLELIQESLNETVGNVDFLQPARRDINKESPDRDTLVRRGIEGMPEMAEIYPVGGAGDRLNLIDPEDGIPLPAAELRFGGQTLLERLVEDLKGRELLYERMIGESIETPIVLMTSVEKDNDRRIRKILENRRWFGRSPDSFYLIIQPLVPVITVEGHWVMTDVFQLYQKPGGHGVLWKLMEDQGAFEWLLEKRKTKALVRQINNPLAGDDDSLLAFTGVGLKEDKAFGFASCPRKVNASEGMDVLIKSERKGCSSYKLTNIEYTDFKKHRIEDTAEKEGSPYSVFPANTNILFVDLAEVRSRVQKCPVPGMLINLKSTALYKDPCGTVRELRAGRLESTMQNIADTIVFDSEEPEKQPVYLTYNSREKTIGVTKQAFKPENVSDETPEFCYYTFLSLHRDLLADNCGINVPGLLDKDEYLKNGPNLIFLFSPLLGPGYSLIAKKIRGGEIADGSELQLELADVDIENLGLEGSLLIKGGKDTFCRLNQVAVRNKGIDRESTVDYWKNDPVRHESMEIFFEGRGEFIADQVQFEGNQRIIIPDGICLTASVNNGGIVFYQRELIGKVKKWRVGFDTHDQLVAELV